MEKSKKKNTHTHTHTKLNHFAIPETVTQHYKSTIFPFKQNKQTFENKSQAARVLQRWILLSALQSKLSETRGHKGLTTIFHGVTKTKRTQIQTSVYYSPISQ